ncbi:hypothetical protein V4842_26460 [Pseudomonas moraviensis]
MSSNDHNMMRSVPIRELANPRYLLALQEFAGEVAPFCVAEALLKRFGDENLTARQRFEQIQIDSVMRRTRCDRKVAVDYLEAEDWNEDDAAISLLRDRKFL